MGGRLSWGILPINQRIPQKRLDLQRLMMKMRRRKVGLVLPTCNMQPANVNVVQSNLAPDEGSRTHKRVLSSSETDSPAQSKALSKKRAWLSSGMPGAPSFNPASVPSAPSTSLSTSPSPEPSNKPSTLIPQTSNPQPLLASPQEDGPDAGRAPVPSGKTGVGRHRTGKHHVTDDASEPERRMNSLSEHSETQKPLGSGNHDQAPENAQEATPDSEYEDSDDPEIYGEPKLGKSKCKFF